MNFSTPGFPVHHQLLELLKLMFIKSAMPSNHLILRCPLLLLPSNLSQHQDIFQWVSSLHHVVKLLELQLQVQYQSFQWIFKGLSKGLSRVFSNAKFKSINSWCSAFFMVQLSHPYMTTGKNIALIRWTFVGKVMSLLFNMLSRLVIAFPPRSKCLLTSWLQSPSVDILEPQSIKSVTVSIASPSICHEGMGPDAMILVFWMLKTSSRGMGRLWLGAGLGALSVIVSARPPFEGGHHYLHYLHNTLASDQTTGREHRPAHQQKIGLKIYWAWALPIRTRPSFPLNQFLPSGSFHKSLILICQRADKMKTTITEN